MGVSLEEESWSVVLFPCDGLIFFLHAFLIFLWCSFLHPFIPSSHSFRVYVYYTHSLCDSTSTIPSLHPFPFSFRDSLSMVAHMLVRRSIKIQGIGMC